MTRTRSSVEESWPMTVGAVTQAVIAAVCRQGVPKTPYLTRLAVADAARDATRDVDLTKTRATAFRVEVASYASAYLHRWVPDDTWCLLGAEYPLTASRADLVWRHHSTGWVVIDELKTGAGRHDHGDHLDQVFRHLDGATRVWGELTQGVRLVWLAAPQLSQWYQPGRQRSRSLAGSVFDRHMSGVGSGS